MRCVREITGIWRAAAVLCAAAFAMTWCFAFPFAPAYADEGGVGASADDDTIVVSVPTTVPCALLSDGTVVAPTSWKIENSGSTPARLAMATAKPAYEDISVSAKANGSTLLDYSAGFASYDPTLNRPRARLARCELVGVPARSHRTCRPVRAGISKSRGAAFGVVSLLRPVDGA